MLRRIKYFYKTLLARAFHLGQHFGFDILPRHFYSEIPDIRKLKATQHWKEPFSMTGVLGADIDEQLEFARKIITPSVQERILQGNIYRLACRQNGNAGYGPIEADFLFAFVASMRPRRIVQVGCGVSTAVCLQASSYVNYKPHITCIEPYPNSYLKRLSSEGTISLIPEPVESLNHHQFLSLADGDLFFVDSSHTLGPAGEVSRIVLEILPRLADGVYIHHHDVWFPYDYRNDILTSALFFWHESSMLLAFLTNNQRVKILTSLSMLHHQRQNELRALLLHYQPLKNDSGLATTEGHYPSSIFLQVTEQKNPIQSVMVSASQSKRSAIALGFSHNR